MTDTQPKNTWIESRGWSYTQAYETGTTSNTEWDEDEFGEWITRELDNEQLNSIIEESDKEDDKWTYTILDNDGNEIYSISVWASVVANKTLAMRNNR